MRTHTSLLLLLLLLLCSITLLSHPATAQTNAGAAGWKRIKDVKYYHVVDIADFAVSEHNKQTGLDLKFVRVVRGEVDVDKYRLVIVARDRMRKHRYEALVWEKLWDKLRVLISFRLLA